MSYMTNRLRTQYRRAKKAMSPSWDSFTDLEAYQSTLKLLLICAAPVGALLAAGAAGWWTWYNTKIERRISELRSAEDNRVANAKALQEKGRADRLDAELAKANKTLADTKESLAQAHQSIASLVTTSNDIAATSKDISAKVSNRSSMLSAAARTKLVERLKKLPPKSIGCTPLNDSPEAAEFGADIRKLFAAAGCLSDGGIFLQGVSGINLRGVIVDPVKPEAQSVAVELAAALKEAGVPDVRIERAGPRSGSLVSVVVGAK
jgi:hypothetical protein